MLVCCAELCKEGNKINWEIWIGMAQLIVLLHDYFVCFAFEFQFGHIVLIINQTL